MSTQKTFLLSISILLVVLSVSWNKSPKQNPICNYPIDYSDTSVLTAKVGDFLFFNEMQIRGCWIPDYSMFEVLDSFIYYANKHNLCVEV